MTRRPDRPLDRGRGGREDEGAPEVPYLGGHDRPADTRPWRPNPLERDLMEGAE